MSEGSRKLCLGWPHGPPQGSHRVTLRAADRVARAGCPAKDRLAPFGAPGDATVNAYLLKPNPPPRVAADHVLAAALPRREHCTSRRRTRSLCRHANGLGSAPCNRLHRSFWMAAPDDRSVCTPCFPEADHHRPRRPCSRKTADGTFRWLAMASTTPGMLPSTPRGRSDRLCRRTSRCWTVRLVWSIICVRQAGNATMDLGEWLRSVLRRDPLHTARSRTVRASSARRPR